MVFEKHVSEEKLWHKPLSAGSGQMGVISSYTPSWTYHSGAVRNPRAHAARRRYRPRRTAAITFTVEGQHLKLLGGSLRDPDAAERILV